MADETTPAVENQEPIPPGETPAPEEPRAQAQGEAQEQPAEEPKYVTREELDGLAADILRRAKQSDRDRSRKIEDQLNGIKHMLEVSGTPLQPEQEANLRNQITDQIDAEDEGTADGSATQPTTPGLSPVDQFLDEVFAEAGAKVTPNDPEWKDLQKVLDDNFTNPKGLPKVLLAANAAANAKKARTATMQESAAARVGGGGTKSTGTVVQGSAREMLNQAFGNR